MRVALQGLLEIRRRLVLEVRCGERELAARFSTRVLVQAPLRLAERGSRLVRLLESAGQLLSVWRNAVLQMEASWLHLLWPLRACADGHDVQVLLLDRFRSL